MNFDESLTECSCGNNCHFESFIELLTSMRPNFYNG